jgi:hypothetical protein
MSSLLSFTGENCALTAFKPVQATQALLTLLFHSSFEEKRLWKR